MHLFRHHWSNRLRSCLLAATLSIGFTSFAAAAIALPAGIKQGPSAEGITEYRFANGLKVLLFPDSSEPTMTVNMTYLVGSRFENYGETGMAHLLERLIFKGTPKHPSIRQDFSQLGMSFNGTAPPIWIAPTISRYFRQVTTT